MTAQELDIASLREEVSNTRWYQSFDLPGNIRTFGEFDLQGSLAHVLLPESLAGKRCLDIGTRDGFWAFEMERRGGDVVAIDLSDPLALDLPWLSPERWAALEADRTSNRSRGFDVAHRALGSRVEYREFSVYDLDEAEFGTFDFAVLGTMLLHLRDPIGALAAARRVVGGQLMLNEVVSPTLSVLKPRSPAATLERNVPFWWIPNVAALRRYAEAAGFRVVKGPRMHLLKVDPRRPRLGWRDRGNLTMLEFLIFRQVVPHACLLVAPQD